MWTELADRLAAALSGVDPGSGTVVEFGAGTGLGTDVLSDHDLPLRQVAPAETGMYAITP